MQLFDTHCHIHEATFELKGDDATRSLWAKAGKPDPADLIQQAADGGVVGMICVGTTADDSALAVRFVQNYANCWASIGIHPHEAKEGEGALERLADLLAPPFEHLPLAQASSANKQLANEAGKASLHERETARTGTKPEAIPFGEQASSLVEPLQDSVASGRKEGTSSTAALARTDGRSLEDEARDAKIVAIGECGLDYFYGHSPKEDQVKALRFQIELALTHNLPMIFHVRDAFDDFWPIFDEYKSAGQRIRGVVHSFTDNQANLDKILARGLYVGVNGIATFTKSADQLAMYKAIPLNNLVCETDAPFLTPAPIRGRVNAPVNVRLVAEFLAELRGESPKDFAQATTHNARKLFNL